MTDTRQEAAAALAEALLDGRWVPAVHHNRDNANARYAAEAILENLDAHPDAAAKVARYLNRDEWPDRRLIDTQPRIGALVDDIALELSDHGSAFAGASECICGGRLPGELWEQHVAKMVDYRLTATDGDA